jgi:adenylate cyclase
LARSGAQGWQLALLAPGWVHGCLGLWLSLQRFAPIRRAKPMLVAIMVLVPLLSAAGFLRMDRAVSIANATPSTSAIIPGPRASLEPWREAIMASYIALVAGAFLAGRVSSR